MDEKQKMEDLERRVKGFNEKLLPLLGEYQLGLTGIPFITPDGRIAARPHVIDDSERMAKEDQAAANKISAA